MNLIPGVEREHHVRKYRGCPSAGLRNPGPFDLRGIVPLDRGDQTEPARHQRAAAQKADMPPVGQRGDGGRGRSGGRPRHQAGSRKRGIHHARPRRGGLHGLERDTQAGRTEAGRHEGGRDAHALPQWERREQERRPAAIGRGDVHVADAVLRLGPRVQERADASGAPHIQAAAVEPIADHIGIRDRLERSEKRLLLAGRSRSICSERVVSDVVWCSGGAGVCARAGAGAANSAAMSTAASAGSALRRLHMRGGTVRHSRTTSTCETHVSGSFTTACGAGRLVPS